MFRFLTAPWKFLRKPLHIPITSPEPPDPVTLPYENWGPAVQARIDAGLKPWPGKPDDHYFNSINGVCSICGIHIYGGQAISFGPEGTRCQKHFSREGSDP